MIARHQGSLRLAVAAAILCLAPGASAETTTARALRTTGTVVVSTNLSYGNGAASGTGMVVSRNGQVLTNNHVIRGARTITVVDPRTGRRSAATVSGYAIGADVAVLTLANASGFAPVSLGSSSSLSLDDEVTAVGNAGGTGKLVSSPGTITALGRSITVVDDQGASVRMKELIETDADLRPGDSGGPLFDASGRVIGMNTAASTGFSFRSGESEGYAIPINRALALARQIIAGRSSSGVHVGPTAFLGILAQPSRYADVPGVLIRRVVDGSPADRAGLVPGVVVTKIGGTAVTSTTAVVQLLQRKKPGQTITITWIDRVGNRTTASVKLATGPPQ